ncbi:MAG: hypothetical protein J1D86_05555 [Alistipes sp.]|nr:hypothetical protein [Alistipes sp.]
MKRFLLLICAVMAFGAGAQAQSYGAPYSSIRCMNVELDGSITVRVSGSGRNRLDAKEQARKNAVYNVIFKGVKVEGHANSDISRPLVFEVNAEEKYADFMYEFFADGGKYLEFTSMDDRRWLSNSKTKGGKQVEWEITLRVLRPQLRRYLIEQGIIKK